MTTLNFDDSRVAVEPATVIVGGQEYAIKTPLPALLMIDLAAAVGDTDLSAMTRADSLQIVPAIINALGRYAPFDAFIRDLSIEEIPKLFDLLDLGAALGKPVASAES